MGPKDRTSDQNNTQLTGARASPSNRRVPTRACHGHHVPSRGDKGKRYAIDYVRLLRDCDAAHLVGSKGPRFAGGAGDEALYDRCDHA